MNAMQKKKLTEEEEEEEEEEELVTSPEECPDCHKGFQSKSSVNKHRPYCPAIKEPAPAEGSVSSATRSRGRTKAEQTAQEHSKTVVSTTKSAPRRRGRPSRSESIHSSKSTTKVGARDQIHVKGINIHRYRCWSIIRVVFFYLFNPKFRQILTTYFLLANPLLKLLWNWSETALKLL